MTYLVILAALALLPVLAIVLLRVNGAVAFMSLCMGSVLATYVSGDVSDIFTSFAAKGTLSTGEWVQLGLLVVPFLLAVLFTRGSVRGRGKKFMNVLPALASGMLLALLTVPVLPGGMQSQVQGVELWHQIDSLQTAIVLGGAAFTLLFILLSHRGSGGEEDKKHG